MNRTRRDELDILIERALRNSVANEAPPDRVWADISLRVQGRRKKPRSRFEYLRDLGTEIMTWGGDAISTTRIIFTPSIHSYEAAGWTDRLVLAGHSSTRLHYSIHH